MERNIVNVEEINYNKPMDDKQLAKAERIRKAKKIGKTILKVAGVIGGAILGLYGYALFNPTVGRHVTYK